MTDKRERDDEEINSPLLNGLTSIGAIPDLGRPLTRRDRRDLIEGFTITTLAAALVAFTAFYATEPIYRQEVNQRVKGYIEYVREAI